MTAVDAADVMGLLPARPRLLALGEPVHGEEVLLSLRNELFRHLVERDGFGAIAMESDCVKGLVVDDYITSGTGSLDEVMARGFSHGFGAFAGNRELVAWMRSHNDGRPASQRLRFAGFDGPLEITAAQSPRQALTSLHAYLTARVDEGLLGCTAAELDRLLGADDRWTNPAAMTDPSQSIGRAPEASQLRLLADDLAALLETQAPQLIAASRDDWDRARLYGRTAIGLLRYHHAMADTAPMRLAGLLSGRASMMAANLLAIAEQGPALVNAHNGHLQRDQGAMRMGGVPLRWWGAGAIVSARLGQDYAFLATALGTITSRGVQAPPPDTIEGLLYQRPADQSVLGTRELTALAGDGALAPRVSPWFGYSPLDPAQLASMDGVVFVRDSR